MMPASWVWRVLADAALAEGNAWCRAFGVSLAGGWVVVFYRAFR